jgi:phosphoglycolate phosphatase-like HAD superfamily hydrolase
VQDLPAYSDITLKLEHRNADTCSMNATSPSSDKIMLDFDSTVFRLLDAMQLIPGGERVKYEDCPTWEYLMHLCGPEAHPDGSPVTDAERLQFMLDLFAEAMKLEHMHQLGADGVFEGCREALADLTARGVEILVVTDRPAELIEGTAQFLRDHDLPFDEIHRVSGRDKTQWCIDNGVRVMVDDHPDTLTEAIGAGLTGLSLSHLYNRHVEGAILADTWADLAPKIDEALAAAKVGS